MAYTVMSSAVSSQAALSRHGSLLLLENLLLRILLLRILLLLEIVRDLPLWDTLWLPVTMK